MGWRILVNLIGQPMLKLKRHSGLHDLFIITPSLKKNSAAKAVSTMFTSEVIAWALKINTQYLYKIINITV
jgi:hypothetical protein